MDQICIVSDTHLGNQQFQSTQRREDFAVAFDEMMRIAVAEDVDAVVHAGDLFDHPQPRVEDINRCVDAIQRLAAADIPFYGIVGNHERKLQAQWLDLIDRFDQVKRLSTDPLSVGDHTVFYGIDAIRGPQWEQHDFTLTPLDDDRQEIVVMHQLFEPLVDEIMADYSLKDVLKRLNITPDQIVVGDYHEYTETTVEGVPALYPGSTERCSRTERGPRGGVLLSVDNDGVRTERITLDNRSQRAPRDFYVIDVTVDPSDTAAVIGDRIDDIVGPSGSIADAVVVVELSGDKTTVSQQDAYRICDERGAAVVEVDDQREIETEFDIEADTSSEADIDTVLDRNLSDLSTEPVVEEIEDVVRDRTTVRKSHLEDRAKELLAEANPHGGES